MQVHFKCHHTVSRRKCLKQGKAGLRRSERVAALIQQSRQDWASQLYRIGENVSKFAGSMSSASVKIAMIGDGLTRFSEQIVAGRSFIQEGESGFRSLRPFYLSPTNHGARMAEIIIQACQSARIYVARVTDIGHGSTKPSLIQNIARVRIGIRTISVSFSVLTEDRQLSGPFIRELTLYTWV